MLKAKPVLEFKPVLKHKQDSGWRAGHPWVMVGARKGGTAQAGTPGVRQTGAVAAEPVLSVHKALSLAVCSFSDISWCSPPVWGLPNQGHS